MKTKAQRCLRAFGIKLNDEETELKRGKESGPVAQAHADVSLSGAVDNHVTATRLVLLGPLAFGKGRKKTDTRKLFLTVEGQGFAWVIPVLPSLEARARKAAASINMLGKLPSTSMK